MKGHLKRKEQRRHAESGVDRRRGLRRDGRWEGEEGEEDRKWKDQKDKKDEDAALQRDCGYHLRLDCTVFSWRAASGASE